jgi:hypothetical protein
MVQSTVIDGYLDFVPSVLSIFSTDGAKSKNGVFKPEEVLGWSPIARYCSFLGTIDCNRWIFGFRAIRTLDFEYGQRGVLARYCSFLDIFVKPALLDGS